MPHTSKRKKKPGHKKDQQVVLDNGWTRIVRTERSNIYGLQSLSMANLPAQDPSLDLPKLLVEYDKLKTQWLESRCRRVLREILEREGGKRLWATTTKAVALALGSFSRLYNSRRDCMWQLVLFLDTVEFLNAGAASEVKLYAQEPSFCDLDRQFLERLGVTILADPEAEQEIGVGTFLFVPHLEWGIEEPFRRKASESSLYMTSDMDWVIDAAQDIKAQYELGDDETQHHDDPTYQTCTGAINSAKAIKGSHTAVSMPEFELSDALHMTVYVLKQVGDGQAGFSSQECP